MLNYKAPNDTLSTIDDGKIKGEQMETFFWLKKAIITARKEQYFMPLASVENMPKHFGKTMKCYEYLPLLDDRNVNSEGIDAEGKNKEASGKNPDGNLYGSSRDIGVITDRLPVLGEEGGRVNRIGFSRIVHEGSIANFGFFYEFTQDSFDFDSDASIMSHLSREAVNGFTQITEAQLQMDLLASAGTVVYPGGATQDDQISGEEGSETVVNYKTLMRLDQILTDNRTPVTTRIITGSRLQDTKVLNACRVAYVGTALVPTLRKITDLFGNPAFIGVQHYADAGNTLNGEIGSIDNFRFVRVPEMLHWAGKGADVTSNAGYRATGGKYDVYPILVVGDDSFSTIGYQTDGKSVKMNIITKMPGQATADKSDPYGKTGFSSVQWFYGFLLKRSERIGLIKTACAE